jgi:hypothetical protein
LINWPASGMKIVLAIPATNVTTSKALVRRFGSSTATRTAIAGP